MEAVQVFIKTEEEEEKEDVLMDGDQFPPEKTSSTEPAELERYTRIILCLNISTVCP